MFFGKENLVTSFGKENPILSFDKKNGKEFLVKFYLQHYPPF